MNAVGSLILVIDAGTTSTRAMLFDREGALRALSQRPLQQHYPAPGLVEHDAREIWTAALACARQVVTQAGGADRIAAIGITNQRETVVAWDKASGDPLARAIVWQDRRTARDCEALRAAGHEPAIQAATGLVIDPYFSATKMHWLIENNAEVRAAAGAGRLALGTVESWLVHRLTGGSYVSDAANASRTSLLPLAGSDWDEGLCDLFGVPRAALPQVCDCFGAIGVARADLLGAPLPITGLAGDQQAATIGQGCLAPGETKATYGTGAFVLANMGGEPPRSAHRLLATVLCQAGGKRTYALEGAVFVAGSLLQWLRDGLGVIDAAPESEALARSVESNGGVVIVPALSGLGAPHWRAEARASITGLSFATSRAHVARAALEAMAMQTRDLAVAFARDGADWTTLRIDGGMSANDWMAQDLADVLDLTVERPRFVETTALGAAMLAATGAGLHASLDDAVREMRGAVETFTPAMTFEDREARIAQWASALETV
ncbi:glycerol kinase [Novosphingobium sp. PC22D]|uniref:glycerol kinase n=1 Tax=Novosphingobium sp. PC22D TaxID=1962403 RepID=UPI000BEF987F|nr:glycerol kinase [Novosphingobium sp. PC22D]PEQ12779.1 glycerol kinase [Novosphingobium sp. PC22D]